MVVELVPGESERVGSVLCVKETVVCVLVTSEANGRQVVVVHPDLGRAVNVDEITTFGSTEELEVTDDDVRDLADLETTVGQARVGSDTEDRCVADELDDAAARKVARDLDDTAGLGCGREGRAGGDSSTGTASTACRTSTEADEFVDLSSTLFHGSSVGRGSGQSRDSNVGEVHAEAVKGA